jgi:hypothetical protein
MDKRWAGVFCGMVYVGEYRFGSVIWSKGGMGLQLSRECVAGHCQAPTIVYVYKALTWHDV